MFGDLITVAYRAWGACRGEKLFSLSHEENAAKQSERHDD
jgi:hypothetical protein